MLIKPNKINFTTDRYITSYTKNNILNENIKIFDHANITDIKVCDIADAFVTNDYNISIGGPLVLNQIYHEYDKNYITFYVENNGSDITVNDLMLEILNIHDNETLKFDKVKNNNFVICDTTQPNGEK